MPTTGGYGNSGAPDFLVCYDGMFIGIECKAGINTPTDLQLKNARFIIRQGGYVFFVNERSVEHFELMLIFLILNSSFVPPQRGFYLL